MEFTPQNESCMQGLWDDAIKESEATKDFLDNIPNIVEYLINYPFLADTGELGVRRINGCTPKQRSVWLKDAYDQKIGVNCFERTRAFLAKNILIFGADQTRQKFQVFDVLITPEIRHVFPVALPDLSWIILNKGEASLVDKITQGTGKLTVMEQSEANVNSYQDDTFANDPVIGGFTKIARDIENKLNSISEDDEKLPHANATDIASINQSDLSKILNRHFGPAMLYHVLDVRGKPVFTIPGADIKFANSDGQELSSATISNVLVNALDPLLTKSTATFAQNLKDENGYIPIRTEFAIDPMTLIAGIAGLSIIVYAIKKK